MFFVFILCFVKHKSVKIFDIHIMQFITIKYKQQIHRVFKFLIWNGTWKSQPIFVTKHFNANVVFSFNPAIIFFLQRKISIIMKLFSTFLTSFVNLSGCIFTGLIGLTWHHKKHLWSLFLMLIKPFFELLNSVGNFT